MLVEYFPEPVVGAASCDCHFILGTLTSRCHKIRPCPLLDQSSSTENAGTPLVGPNSDFNKPIQDGDLNCFGHGEANE